MLKPVIKALALLIAVLAAYTCIDPYNPGLENYESLLVVESLVTDEKVPYEVKLSRSIEHEDSIPERINGAEVYITDETGRRSDFENSGDGVYKTDPSEFTGVPGKTYILHIITSDGSEYVSDPAVMMPVHGIQNIYFEKDEEYRSNQSERQEGIRIYVDTEQNSSDIAYVHWEFEETWKFRLSDYKRYNYINDSVILPLKEVNEYCWRTNRSSVILNGTILPEQDNQIRKAPVCFIPTASSDRLTLQYCILIKQYSISREAFDFWDKLKQVNETGGSIFDKQPYPVISNIKNINDPEDKVLGYFQVSAVKQQRKYITPREIYELDLPYFQYECKRYEVSPEDYPPPTPTLPLMTWNELYDMFIRTGKFTFVEPVYDEETHLLSKLVFTENTCSDCTLSGTEEKPDWWVDLN
ncbi:MAG TPA: DUF4249 domain-containing protein [Bacteroidales bacterium]|jgi:hypothetical protein|nr:DUF4249 domain-containing protein [Bacteroidales bacterium]HOX75315.1 DUF4249 domain-containing protein [Bacteroidales bacterium]HPM88870.1 DUF4249 domain-containing protein [Bacteroidales bacterium]HQM70260.1 DUF4249 domain-containing protein [Bacteroidales bacterium]